MSLKCIYIYNCDYYAFKKSRRVLYSVLDRVMVGESGLEVDIYSREEMLLAGLTNTNWADNTFHCPIWTFLSITISIIL